MSDVVDIAEELANEFRGRAAELDEKAEFPAINYQRMREAGYLRALVPVDLGGLGASLAEMSRAQQALARGCASTALAVNMHQFQVGIAADGWRNGGPTETLLRRISAEGPVLASTGSEAIVAGAWEPSTTAEPREGGYAINGRKFFCSQASGMDLLRVNARDTVTGDLLIFTVPATAKGVKVVPTWDTMGMRATVSHDVVLEEVLVPDSAMGARLPAGAPMETPAFANVGRWFLPLVSGVYLGIAEEARAEAYLTLDSGVNSHSRDGALTDVMIGEMEAAFLTATAVRDQVAAELDTQSSDHQWALSRAILLKEVVMTQAQIVVDKADALAGGRSYYRRSPLERLTRDMRAARYHPPSAPVSFQMAGARARLAYAAR